MRFCGNLEHDGKHWLAEVPVAFVRASTDDPGLADRVRDECARMMADFKVPRAVYVVPEFPLGTLDKILKNRLRELADERPPV